MSDLENGRMLSPQEEYQDDLMEVTLRPQSFSQFIGQRHVVENLKTYIEAALKRKEVLDHVLLSGPPGLGKTTLAGIIAKELGTSFRSTSGPVLKVAGDLAGLLTHLEEGDILFIDEIHRLPPIVEEYLYSAMENCSIDILIDQGPSARSINLKLKPFTLIGATTREGLLTGPFRSRFLIQEKLELYPASDILAILERSAGLLQIKIEPGGAKKIAERSRGTPRVANRFLRRIRDVAQVKGKGVIDAQIAESGLNMLGVDSNGLDMTDRRILKTIIEHGGGPIGLKTIAVSVSEEEDTIETVYEPFLIQEGYLQKTPRGRKVSPKAYEVLGLSVPRHHTLFDNI